MQDRSDLSQDDVRVIARMVELDLPEARLNQLMTTLSAYLTNLERLRAIEPRESEPPTIMFDGEAAS